MPAITGNPDGLARTDPEKCDARPTRVAFQASFPAINYQPPTINPPVAQPKSLGRVGGRVGFYFCSPPLPSRIHARDGNRFFPTCEHGRNVKRATENPR